MQYIHPRHMRSTILPTQVLLSVLAVGGSACLREEQAPAKHTEAPAAKPPTAVDHLTDEQASKFLHQTIGSDSLPLFVLSELKQRDGRPFLKNLERFGLLPDPSHEHNEERLPVGMTVHLPTELAAVQRPVLRVHLRRLSRG